MAKANPKAWFVGPIAKITYTKVDKWARRNEQYRPFFPTWKGAHDWMLKTAGDRVKRLERELASAKRHLDKVKVMTDPGEDAGKFSGIGKCSDMKEGITE